MAQKIIPRGKYIFVRIDEPESGETSAGLIVPANTDAEQKAQGTVVSVGDEVKKDLKKGTHIIFGMFAGESLELNEGKQKVKYKLLYDDDVIAILA
jgi:co-chaperonin GroES (HSP10)